MDHEPNGEGYGHSPRLMAGLSRLWATMASDYGLLPQLPFDAVMARSLGRDGRADRSELRRCAPRLVNLMVDYDLTIDQSIEVIDRLASVSWRDGERSLLVEILDSWWFEVLQRLPGEHPPDYPPSEVLGLVARTGAPMVRWLHVWLDQLDGPAASYLAEAVIDGLSGSAWVGLDDERTQVLTWARSETVVNGLALIGATHLDDGTFHALMDRLIPG